MASVYISHGLIDKVIFKDFIIYIAEYLDILIGLRHPLGKIALGYIDADALIFPFSLRTGPPCDPAV